MTRCNPGPRTAAERIDPCPQPYTRSRAQALARTPLPTSLPIPPTTHTPTDGQEGLQPLGRDRNREGPTDGRSAPTCPGASRCPQLPTLTMTWEGAIVTMPISQMQTLGLGQGK